MAFDLDTFLKTPRLSGLALSHDGGRLVTSVASLAPDGASFVTALWEVDPSGRREPRRLTRSAPGEAGPVFLPNGDLLFTSRRPDPAVKEPDDEVPALWLLPAGGGEARQVASTPAGIGQLRVARDAGTVVLAVDVFPGAGTLDDDRERAKARKDAKVTAVLFEDYPIRFWDHELGPRQVRLFVAEPVRDRQDTDSGTDDDRFELRDLTPEPGRALDETTYDVTPDGSTVIATWQVGGVLDRTGDLVTIDIATGERRTLAHEPHVWFAAPACSPDGRSVVCVRIWQGEPDHAPTMTLVLVDVASSERRDLTPGLDRWPDAPVWVPDGSAVYFLADENGRCPVFRVDVVTGDVRRLSTDGAFADLHVDGSDGTRVYATRSSYAVPSEVVRLDGAAVDAAATRLPSPGTPLTLPGRVEEVLATAEDGTSVRSWLLLPQEASAESPAPLVVFIHGGPLSSWNAWTWRWCPHLLAERGYAVLLPDPALSTGYGQDFIQRGWGSWGAAPYTDLLAAVDATEARADIDATRTAAMGGSFGGYMANWVAGHTDRFRCIITHASLWALDQFHATTDDVAWLEYEFGDPFVDDTRWRENSPHLHLDKIRTPMLVIHGENDDRVPIGEGLRLYTDLKRQGVDAQLLLYPDENHWVLKPNNSRVWYDTVFAWLDKHLLGKDWDRPALL